MKRPTFTQIVNHHEKWLRNYAESLTSKNDVDDLMQDTWAKAYQAWPEFEYRGPQQTTAWLKRLMKNKNIDRSRMRQTRPVEILKPKEDIEKLPDIPPRASGVSDYAQESPQTTSGNHVHDLLGRTVSPPGG